MFEVSPIVLQRIADERQRHEDWKADGRYKFTLRDNRESVDRKFGVLAEEHGEVAKEVVERNEDGIARELIQEAACAIAWLEGLERKGILVCNCEKRFEEHGFDLRSGAVQEGTKRNCPGCGKAWVKIDDEAEGSAWFPA